MQAGKMAPFSGLEAIGGQVYLISISPFPFG
jgi:hypothetical protein